MARNGNVNLASGVTTLREGPWTNAEDAILFEYVRKYGEGNWDAVQYYTGLPRCTKCCRLRWVYHLQPTTPSTPLQQFRITELQTLMEKHKWTTMIPPQVMSFTSESEDSMTSNGNVNLPSVGGARSRANTRVSLKKGPWTNEEDAVLLEYVTTHGEGNWNSVQKHTGLARCGKSCRLRWANHLKPDLKKGAFTPEEEQHIIELHAKMGNKWARMAAELPGRTDNEIKNFWNTRIKRRQRAGLPIYPMDLHILALNESNQNENMSAFSTGDAQNSNMLQVNYLEVPDVEFITLEQNHQLHPKSPLDIPASSMSVQGLNSSYGKRPVFSTMSPSKRLRVSEPFFTVSSSNDGDIFTAFDPYQNDTSMQITQSSGLSPAYYYQNLAPDHSLTCVIPGSHASLIGNSSSLEPACAKKLPSLQSQIDSWDTPLSPLPSFESIDTLIQSPPTERSESANNISPRNSGLLDAVLYQSQNLKHSENNLSQQTSGASMMPGDLLDYSFPDFNDTEWEVGFADPISPLGHSAASVFNEKQQSVEMLAGCKVTPQEDAHLAPMLYGGKDDSLNQIFLASNCFGPNTKHNN